MMGVGGTLVIGDLEEKTWQSPVVNAMTLTGQSEDLTAGRPLRDQGQWSRGHWRQVTTAIAERRWCWGGVGLHMLTVCVIRPVPE